jgi:hypothetical protein
MKRALMSSIVLLLTLSVGILTRAQAPADADRLVAAMLADTPIVSDLQSLLDEIGGRPTGEPANLRSVEWALDRFRAIGVGAKKEAFTMPARWSERLASATVGGDVSFSPRVVAMPFSAGTSADGLTAPFLDGGAGGEADLTRLGDRVKGAWVLVETHELLDIDGLFREYTEATEIEARFLPAGVAGLVYMSSRPNGLLYRHNASLGPDNKHPLLIMEREEALRALRLIRAGKRLIFTARLDLERGGSYESFNVIGEIRGRERPNDIVLIGAHLDSWGLGTGANDNGCNVALVIDLARQIKRLGVLPRRTIRFALWNGEEQGIIGSWGYTLTHAAELDNHVMASSYDIGSGRITGFFTNGRPDLVSLVDRALAPVRGLGPFDQIDTPIVGTDNLDFMLSGVANLVANQEPANYGPNYHARSDTFDKVDLRQLKLNAAIAASVTWGFANMDARLPRHSRAEVEKLMQTTDLGAQMKSMGMWKDWESGRRGIKN